MQKKIEDLLSRQSPMLAREIAGEIGENRKNVNQLLYAKQDTFVRNDEFGWSLISTEEICVTFPGSKWITGEAFEASLKSAGCVISSGCTAVRFVLPKGCFLMLEASARLLALCNQLADLKKSVSIDFEGNLQTLSYLNRSGFLQHLSGNVKILPRRPRTSTSEKFRDKSQTLFEVRAIDPKNFDKDAIRSLHEKFMYLAGNETKTASITIFSELFENVCDHSDTRLPGFAALQSYKRPKPHLQVVVSDSGVGIIEKIKPVLRQNYTKLAAKYDLADTSSQLDLIARIFEQGGISSRDSGDGGAGLNTIRELGIKLKGRISVRQETSELILSYWDGKPTPARKKVNMPRIMGTHICFDLRID